MIPFQHFWPWIKIRIQFLQLQKEICIYIGHSIIFMSRKLKSSSLNLLMGIDDKLPVAEKNGSEYKSQMILIAHHGWKLATTLGGNYNYYWVLMGYLLHKNDYYFTLNVTSLPNFTGVGEFLDFIIFATCLAVLKVANLQI